MSYDDWKTSEDDVWSDPDLTEWSPVYAPERHARIYRLAATAMRISDRPCAFGACEEFRPCGRHRRTVQVACRVERMRGRGQ